MSTLAYVVDVDDELEEEDVNLRFVNSNDPIVQITQVTDFQTFVEK